MTLRRVRVQLLNHCTGTTGELKRFENSLLPRMRGFPSGYGVLLLYLKHATVEVCLMFSKNLQAKKKKKRKRKTALVVCRDRKQFWTTQTQFWQWVRDGVVTKIGDQPLTGLFKREHEELMVLFSNTVLNLAHPNHMREALLSRRVGMAGK
ncbi:MAG TPA: hypothetical protein VK893_11930 [Pyrinomonadaceae bacterium]|nr:hypothetical protein [Pyrinomonadaceae bacterium]